jgi:arabinogalactan endo-1,4-beta-galactosidase
VSGTTGWSNLAQILNAGYAAVKAVDPSIQVVLHLDRGGENALYRWWFDAYQAAGGKWDAIGVSFYPYWQPNDTTAMLSANLNDLVSRYGKPVMVAEVGGLASDPAGTASLLKTVKGIVASVSGGQGLGVFYWEPESAPSVVGGYALGAAQVVSGTQLKLTSAITALGYHP